MSISDSLDDKLAEHFPVSVLMTRRPVQGNRWIDHRWEALGVVTGQRSAPSAAEQGALQADGSQEIIYNGFQVRLHKDECESYFHNLRADQPRCYVITRTDEDDIPRPFLVSLSFDEAHAYLEGDDVDVFSLDIPPALYRWTEAYVLQHYVPVQRKKRKRNNWKEQSS